MKINRCEVKSEIKKYFENGEANGQTQNGLAEMKRKLCAHLKHQIVKTDDCQFFFLLLLLLHL